MTDQPNVVGIDFRSGLQVLYRAQSICREVVGCGRAEVAGRRTGASVIISQNGDAMSREVVGQNEEGFVAKYLLIPVLRTAAADQYDGWVWPPGAGQGQCASQPQIVVPVQYDHLFVEVRVRPLRLLRPVTLQGRCGAFRQDQRQSGERLRPYSRYGVSR